MIHGGYVRTRPDMGLERLLAGLTLAFAVD
jgi:hypothetical protein